MRAATFQAVESVVVTDKPEPTICDPRDVLVDVELAGLCGSDLHPYFGRETGLDVGTTMGHELTGKVIAVGSEVRDFSVGDEVISPFSASCGRCPRCARRLSSRCEESTLFGWVSHGVGLEGAQAERVRVPLADGTLVARPPSFGAVESLLVGDVVATGYFAVTRASPAAGDLVAVVGLGAVGLSAVLVACDLGATVVAFDSVAERLQRAEAWGAIPVAIDRHANTAQIVEEARRVAGGASPSLVVEAVGSSDAIRLAVELIEPGGFLSVAGVHTDAHLAVTPTEAYDKNLTLAMGRCPVRSILPELIDRVRERQLPIAELLTHEFPLDEAGDAYRLFGARGGGVIKGAFRP